MFHLNILNQILHEVNSKEKVDQIMKFSRTIYDLHQFNIFSLYPKQVKKLNDSLSRRYQSNQIKILKTSWNQGERRLFVWLLICFCYVRNVKPEHINDQDWQALSPMFHFKENIFLDFQLKNIFKTPQNKNKWTQQQDRMLKHYIEQLSGFEKEQKGFNNWNDVSKSIFFKTDRRIFKSPKNCRERWYNHLDQSKRKDQFTPEQDYQLISHILNGEKSWSKLVKILGNSRTQHRIKNRYFSLTKKFAKKEQLLHQGQNYENYGNNQNNFENNPSLSEVKINILKKIKSKLELSINIDWHIPSLNLCIDLNQNLNKNQVFSRYKEEKIQKNLQKIQENSIKTVQDNGYSPKIQENFEQFEQEDKMSIYKEEKDKEEEIICVLPESNQIQIKKEGFQNNQLNFYGNRPQLQQHQEQFQVQNNQCLKFPTYFTEQNSYYPQYNGMINQISGITMPIVPFYQYFFYQN